MSPIVFRKLRWWQRILCAFVPWYRQRYNYRLARGIRDLINNPNRPVIWR